MVVLDRDERQALLRRHLLTLLGGEVVGMAVDSDEFGPMREEIAIERQIVLRVCRGGSILEVAHMLAQHRLAVLDQAEAVLELATQSQDLRLAVEALWQCQGGGGVASRPP